MNELERKELVLSGINRVNEVKILVVGGIVSHWDRLGVVVSWGNFDNS
jgi:hypothetical protein